MHILKPIFTTLIISMALSIGFMQTPCCAADPDTVNVRVPSHRTGDIALFHVIGRIDYGSFSIVKLSKADADQLIIVAPEVEKLRRQDAYSLSGHTVRPKFTKALSGKRTNIADWKTYVVQLVGPVKPEWMAEYSRLGIRIVGYVPENTFIVWANDSKVSQLLRSSFVKGISDYDPNWKIAPALSAPSAPVNGLIVSVIDNQSSIVKKRITTLRGTVVRDIPGYDDLTSQIVCTLDAAAVTALAQIPQVIRIDPMPRSVELDDEAACQIASKNMVNNIPSANPTYRSWLDQIGFDGTGSVVSVVDSGCDSNNPNNMHTDLAGRIASVVKYSMTSPYDVTGHGTHVAGIIAGTGATGKRDSNGFLYGQGIAPGSRLVIQNIMSSTYVPPIGGWSVLTKDAVAGGASITNNSWHINQGSGSNVDVGYTNVCATYDSLVRDGSPSVTGLQPLTVVFSVGNAGSELHTLQEPEEAKNVITVGASENYRPTQPLGSTCGNSSNVNGVASLSSRGPCRDGRIAPTIVAPGTQIASLATRYPGTYAYTTGCSALIAGTNSEYAWMSGTSQAAPMVSGAIALISQWWKSTHSGANPSPAMAKALLVNGADDLGGGPDGRGGTLSHIPNGDQGWGRLNTAASVNPQGTYCEDQESVFTATGQAQQYIVRVLDTSKPLKITMVWTDAPGTPGSQALVNDLDLEVNCSSTTYYGNSFQNGWSIQGGSRDNKNNTECVYIQSPPTNCTVTVVAANIAGNAIPGNTSPLDQDYALVIRNGTIGGATLTPYQPVSPAVPPQPDLYQTSTQAGGWSAVAIRTAAGKDNDIVLYSDPGYANVLAASTRRGDAIDFVAIDGNRAASGLIYPAVQAFSGQGNYTIQLATSSGFLQSGVSQSNVFGASDIMRTWDVYVPAATQIAVRVFPISGNIDVGLSIMQSTAGAPETCYRARNRAVAEVDSAGAGGQETLVATLPAEGKYGVLVWSKGGSGDYYVMCDTTPPMMPLISTSIFSSNAASLTASWYSTDSETGIQRYLFAIGTYPGGSDTVGWTDVGYATSITRSGLNLFPGRSYYFTVQAVNGFGLTSQATSNPILVTQTMPDTWAAKQLPDDYGIYLSSKVVTAVFSDRFYVEDRSRTSGIGVIMPSTFRVGDVVNIAGRLKTITGERVVEPVDVRP